MFGNRVCTDVVKLIESHVGFGWALNTMIGTLLRGERFRNTHGERSPFVDRSRDGSKRSS